MKIAIVTFYRVLNYGAMLQAFALWKTLESLGHNVVFVQQSRLISRRPPLWDLFLSRNLKSAKAKFQDYIRWPISDFAEHYPQTVFCQTLDDVRHATEDCDAFIVGSDQIWNSEWWWTNEDLRIAMLDFVPEGKPRLSYAVSFGNKEWTTPENAHQVGECLRKFTKISVREQSGIDLVQALSGRTDAICLPDPTLLYTANFYREIIAKTHLRQEANTTSSYIFKYVLAWDDAGISERALAAVKNKLGLATVKDVHTPIHGLPAPICRLCGVTAKIPVPEWLSNIANADIVFTDSFHGTVFAILFHKPFVSLLIRSKMKGMNERILSLLGILGLSDRAVYADEVEKWLPRISEPVDWNCVDRRLSAYRRQAESYLSSID